jgi:phage repressor protein C with HTH and peptisase S24 domain
MNELEQLLKEIQYRTNESIEQIASRIGYSRPYLNTAKTKGNGKIVELLKSKYRDILQSVSSQPTIPSNITLSPEGKVKKQRVLDQFNQVPFYDVDFAAGNIEMLGTDNVQPSYMMDIPIFKGCAAFNVYSDSMEPLMKAGNIMFCSKLKNWRDHLEFGQIYAISMDDNRRYLKYIRKSQDPDKFLLESANPFYEPFEIPTKMIRSVWLIDGWMSKKTQ